LTDLVTTLQELGDLEVAGHVFGPREFKRCSVLTLRRLSYRKRRFSPSVSAYLFDVGLPYAKMDFRNHSGVTGRFNQERRRQERSNGNDDETIGSSKPTTKKRCHETLQFRS
jgi:hypothetical protein